MREASSEPPLRLLLHASVRGSATARKGPPLPPFLRHQLPVRQESPGQSSGSLSAVPTLLTVNILVLQMKTLGIHRPTEIALAGYENLLQEAQDRPSTVFPPEKELARRWKVSQSAVNRAAMRLIASGPAAPLRLQADAGGGRPGGRFPWRERAWPC